MSENMVGRGKDQGFWLLDEAEVVEQLVSEFRQATPDNLGNFWNSTQELGRVLASTAIREGFIDGEDKLFLVGAPRGTFSLLAGAAEILPQSPLLVTNDGGWKDKNLPLIPDIDGSINCGDTMVLVDSVIDTGATARRTVYGLMEKGIDIEKILLFSVIAYPPAVDGLLSEFSGMTIISADTESNRIAALDGSDGCWLAGFGDAGGLAEQSADIYPELKKYLLKPGLYC